MYKINDTVIYGTDGICTVTDIAEREVCGKTDVYYILKPLHRNGATIMVPSSNPVLVSRLRKLLTPDEVKKLVSGISSQQGAAWIDNEKQRKQTYRDVILHGDRCEMISFIKTIYDHSEHMKRLGKKVHACDERFLEEAQRILHEEFSVVLGISREEVISYISESISSSEKNA